MRAVSAERVSGLPTSILNAPFTIIKALIAWSWVIRDPGLFNIRVDPLLDPLRGEPRFEAIVRKLNFPA